MYKYILANNDLEGGATKNRYAIYLAPNLNKKSDEFLKNCNPLWGGLHVTLVGFHNNHPPLKSNVRKASTQIYKLNKNKKKHKMPWKINPKHIRIKKNKIYFKSKSLDKLSSWFRTKGFYNVKSDWHITVEDCKIPNNIKDLLKDLTWSLVIVELGNKINWKDKFMLYY